MKVWTRVFEIDAAMPVAFGDVYVKPEELVRQAQANMGEHLIIRAGRNIQNAPSNLPADAFSQSIRPPKIHLGDGE